MTRSPKNLKSASRGLSNNGYCWQMCHEQNYQKVTNAKVVDPPFLINSCGGKYGERAAVIASPSLTITAVR